MNRFRPIAFFVLVVFLAACAAGQNETPPPNRRSIGRSTSPPRRPPTNIAQNSEVTASAQTQTDLPGNAVDGNVETVWNAGTEPAQWIQINLRTAATVSSIHLTPC